VYLQSAGAVTELLANSSEGRGFPVVNQSAAGSNNLGFEWAFTCGLDWLIFFRFFLSASGWFWLVVSLTVLLTLISLVACADDSASFLLTLFRCPVFSIVFVVVVVIAVFYIHIC